MWGTPKGSKVEDRLGRQADAKKALLERFKQQPKPGDAVYEARQAELKTIADARKARQEERARLKAIEDARLAEEARQAAEKAAKAAAEEAAIMEALKREEEEKHLELLATQKAARDARYAARKAAKKERRRGY